MEKSNQPPKTEDCSADVKPVELWLYQGERPLRSVSREKREPQAGPATRLSNSASKAFNASGEAVTLAEPHIEATDTGEVAESLPGSKSVARVERDTRNEGETDRPCRTNYEGQAGREAQRQEALSGQPGIGSPHSTQPQGVSPEAGEGGDRLTQSAQATSAVRLTDQHWQTFLRAIHSVSA